MPNSRQPETLSHAVGRGVSWMLLASVIGKLSSLIAQIILGWFLFDADFGVYAIALSITVVFQVFRDGGARKILMQRGPARFAGLITPVFWVSAMFNVATAIGLIAIAPAVADFYAEPDLLPMLWIIGIGTLVSTIPSLYLARLAVLLRYRDLSKITSTSAVARQVVIVVCVLLGLGPISFAVPFLLCPLLEHVLCHRACGPLGLRRDPRFRLWKLLLFTSGWLMVGAGALAFVRQGFSAVLGAFHTTELLGVFFFGYQIVLQINVLVATNLQPVLLPALTTLKGQAERHSAAIIRCVGSMSLLSSAAVMTLMVSARDLEMLLWGGKWSGSVAVIQWLAIFFPVRMTQSVLEPALLSRGLNRTWALLMIVQAGIVIGFALVAGSYCTEAWQFGAVMGAGFGLSNGLVGLVGAWRLRVKLREMLAMFLRPWLLAVACGLCVLALRDQATQGIIGRAGALWRLPLFSFVFVLMYVLLARILMPRLIMECVSILPRRYSNRFRRVLRLAHDR